MTEEEQQLKPKDLVEQLGRTKKRIIIELYRQPVGYKKLSKILGVGLDTIRSHIKSGKYSRSLLQLGCVERGEKGWTLSSTGKEVAELLKEDPELKGFFYND